MEKQKEKKFFQKSKFESEIRIFKEKDKTYIYERIKNNKKNKNKKDNIKDIKNLERKLCKAHAILIKFNNEKLLSKKRKPEFLFYEDIFKKK